MAINFLTKLSSIKHSISHDFAYSLSVCIFLAQQKISKGLLNYNLKNISISMTEKTIYKPKTCAFHPKELIVNFCKNSECLLPLCPSCINIHTEQHRSEQTYGRFQNINKVVGQIDSFFAETIKELGNCCEEIRQQKDMRVKQQQGVKKKILEAKSKMLTIVERFFTDFEKEVAKSIICYNESMKESYGKVTDHIEDLKKEIIEKTTSLGNDKVLKVIIGYHAKEEQKKYNEQVQSIKNRITYLGTQRVEVVCEPVAIQSVIEEMGNYIHLAFQNWQHQIKYTSDFVKSDMNSTGESGFNRVKV